jgi:hypothetical protein
MDTWRRFKRDDYLGSLLRHDGRGDVDTVLCPSCAGKGLEARQAPHWRCADCFGDVMYCASCIVHNH